MRSRSRWLGVGKTHLAEGLGHQAARQGYRVEFIKTSRLLSDLGGGHADGTWDGRLRHYLLPALLIIDDFAMREYTTQAACIQRWARHHPLPVVAIRALPQVLRAPGGRAHELAGVGTQVRP